jgi:hypothetical protein
MKYHISNTENPVDFPKDVLAGLIETDEDINWVEYDKLQLVIMKAQIELLQRVNRLVELLEKQYD